MAHVNLTAVVNDITERFLLIKRKSISKEEFIKLRSIISDELHKAVDSAIEDYEQFLLKTVRACSICGAFRLVHPAGKTIRNTCRYCSDACRVKAYRRRQKKAKQLSSTTGFKA